MNEQTALWELIENALGRIKTRRASVSMTTYYEAAKQAAIDIQVLDDLKKLGENYHPADYFCLPADLIAQPTTIVYYRNLALLTEEEVLMCGIDVSLMEKGSLAPTNDQANKLACLFNRIVCKIILTVGIESFHPLELILANVPRPTMRDRRRRAA